MTARQRLLLHVCCGPCAAHPIVMLRETYELSMFFANANIAPEAEYRKRLGEARRLAALCEVPLIEAPYDHDRWLAFVKGLEQEPEGGRRCEQCFTFNLEIAADYALANQYDLFTTTLTVSPHKNSETIFRIGKAVGPFLAVDLKKQDGYRRSVELSKLYDLYRQTYCGCEFSIR